VIRARLVVNQTLEHEHRKRSLRPVSIAVAGGLLSFGLLTIGGCVVSIIDFEFNSLEFPIEDPQDVARMAAFGIPKWSGTEPHNGIDIIVDESLERTRINSPTAGIVARISASENPFSDPTGQLLVTIAIRVNGEWTVNLVLEPSTIDSAIRAEQLSAIMVSEGQEVAVGTPIADLLVGTLGYPHLHYMVLQNGEPVCAYAQSSATATAVFDGLAQLPASNLSDGNICYGAP